MDEWERCAPYIADALEGAYTLEDVYREIEEGRAQFWPMRRSAVVTRIHRYPRGRVLRIWIAGGDLDELLGYLPAVDNYAREQDCNRVEIEGRKGWAKVLPGYRETKVVLTKEIR